MPLTESRKRANDKWDAEHLKRLSLAIPMDLYQAMQEYIKESGESVNRFIRSAIEEKISK